MHITQNIIHIYRENTQFRKVLVNQLYLQTDASATLNGIQKKSPGIFPRKFVAENFGVNMISEVEKFKFQLNLVKLDQFKSD